jgi:hypothetical protein
MNDNFNTRMVLTTAVFAAVAALLVGPASAFVTDDGGGGGSGTSVTAQPTVQPGTIPYLSHGTGVDQSQFAGQPDSTAALRVDALDPAIATAIATREAVRTSERSERRHVATGDGLDPAIRTAIAAEASAKQAAQSSATSGPIPYLSHGIGVDQSLFQGEQQQSLGLTGDSPITRVVGQEPAGLTGDSPRTRGQVFQDNATFASNGDADVNWTWVGFGAGMAALLAAAMGALYLSARHRDRVALP